MIAGLPPDDCRFLHLEVAEFANSVVTTVILFTPQGGMVKGIGLCTRRAAVISNKYLQRQYALSPMGGITRIILCKGACKESMGLGNPNSNFRGTGNVLYTKTDNPSLYRIRSTAT
jgi:hypothetical protein